MQYTTVFEAGRQGFPWLILFPGLGLSLIALWGWRLFSARPVPPAKQDQAVVFSRFAHIFAAISLVITITLTVMVWQQYKSARGILRRGDFETVEGLVQHFHPMRAEGHDTERFSLGGVEFKYSSGWGAVYFNSDLNHGYIHDGIRARISYKNEEILKVEVNSADIPTQNKSPFDKR